VVFVIPRIYPRICLAICPEFCHDGKYIRKNMVSRNFRQTRLLDVGLTQILVDHAPLSIVSHVGLHVDFPSTNFIWAFRPSPPSVKWTWTISAFSTNESSYIAMVKGPSTLRVKWPLKLGQRGKRGLKVTYYDLVWPTLFIIRLRK